jgi:ribonuclease D
MTKPKIHLPQGDLPADVKLTGDIAVDCEMMGLSIKHDRLCLIQLRARDGDIHLVKIARGQKEAPHLKKILEDKNSVKMFHFARVDIAMISEWLGIKTAPVYCTKIASKLARTYGNFHGLKDCLRDLLGVEISKQQNLTDWGQDTLTPEQLEYAATDVLHLHALKDKLVELLVREDKTELAQACFDFLPTLAELDRRGWEDRDIFVHTEAR